MKFCIGSTFTESTDTPAGISYLKVLLSTGIAVILLGWSLSRACSTVAPCQMPREWDVLRDIGIAQSLEEGRYPEDPSLAGEISWYNPLTGALLAVLRKFNEQSLMRLAVVSGPYINLLAPAAFYLLTALWFGQGAAVAGLCLYLFGKDGTSPSTWTCAYSPWLLAPAYSAGLLFLTLATFKKALEKKTSGVFIAAGLLLGLTFLGHTAPAVIAGGSMVLLTGMETCRMARQKDNRQEARRLVFHLLLSLGIAFFISLPFTGPILWRYQFHVLNPWPSLYASQNVELQKLPEQIWTLLSMRNLIALFGAAGLCFQWRRLEVRALACWSLVVMALMVQHYAWQALRLNGIVIPSIVPGHHAVIHLAAVRTVLFGTGIVFAGKWSYRFLAFLALRLKLSCNKCLCMETCCAGALVIIAGLCLYLTNPYSRRVDFLPPAGAAHYDLYERHVPMYEWIRDTMPPEATVLCPEETLGIKTVLPSGRKLVNPMLLYFNPYVDRGPKTLRQEAILAALDKRDKDALCEEANVYPILLLLLEEPVQKAPPFATEIHRAGGSVLFEIHSCLRRFE
ncbi:MAG: hypothetical protein BWX80_03296 [Candidatus Hydrogenedentes bacterium ADurb.Bin101]|nr:MAG: hypothetical protein BWX80_03296 [Candidatus Hydrogenedentes bacterium ADurb.Bin101]HOC69921.1 hypothetical protein [Candidatus Hydrogenedentota bacterium]